MQMSRECHCRWHPCSLSIFVGGLRFALNESLKRQDTYRYLHITYIHYTLTSILFLPWQPPGPPPPRPRNPKPKPADHTLTLTYLTPYNINHHQSQYHVCNPTNAPPQPLRQPPMDAHHAPNPPKRHKRHPNTTSDGTIPYLTQNDQARSS